MYLKSLVLKGFKSFADRSVLALEPGITAIVGPNGSGKSNISDAVLWVLGERSARNLRGQAMEDIIFSGSAARKAVSVAEVDLVLDNSDHTLPVDFDEVVITRRMYRSGESEYLLNGVVARRLDVLDILHDTGLGTGTHSIISQGSLDSILQSRPEDRRALIEEAAGVLKHKQRKEKSARKIERMDAHLDRVRDVVAEVTRQLGPLERKAKRAEAFKKASGELFELRLMLAVDDLRTLQREWNAVCAAEKSVAEEVEAKRETVSAAEQKVSECQELMRRESEDAGTLAKLQRRASSLSEKLDTADMMLRERRRGALGMQADMRTALQGSAQRRNDAVRELDAAKAQLTEIEADYTAAEKNVALLGEQRSQLDERNRRVEEAIDRLSAEVLSFDASLDEAKRSQALLQESLANGLAQVKVVEARRLELSSNLAKAVSDHEESGKALDKASEVLVELETREAKAQEQLIVRFEQRDETHAARDKAHEEVRLIEAEIKAIEQAQMAQSMNEPAVRWVLENSEQFDAGLVSVSKAFRVSQGLEMLVERLLGEELSALAVNNADAARSIAAALSEGEVKGDVSVVMRDGGAPRRKPRSLDCDFGKPLIGQIEYGEEMAAVVEALLGDVVVCETREEAFAGHARGIEGVRFVSLDGCAVWPSGRVKIFGVADEEGEGVIARERRLSDLQEGLTGAVARKESADKAAAAADDAYREIQVESLKLSQQLANSQGAHSAALAEHQRTERRLSAVKRDIEEVEEQAKVANERIGDLKPEVEAVAAEIVSLTDKRAQKAQERDAALQQVAPMRAEAQEFAEKLSEARLSAATLAERKTYTERIVVARERDIEVLASRDAEQRRSIAVKEVVITRGNEALEALGKVAANLSRRVKLLDEAVSASESTSNDVHARAAAARDDARRAHDDYDATSARMAQVRVDKSRLEVRVEAAVNAIVHDLGVPMDHAQEQPVLENRREVEDEAFRLKRKIKNMGSINPDAADEYAELKERYDFMAGQLADMEAARKSLGRIVRVIDARMKDDFVNTYKQVNTNFNEIFSLLFPGGQAHLSLEDPDDIENTGVEVTAQPRGKRLTKMMLMSGGEKSLTALALLFAVYKTRATPFYILDEVEAALDDTNLRRLSAYIDSLRSSTQLIMITHQRRTMEMADVLFGVSMQADGVTKVISQKLEHALENSA